jgi:minor extracellular serine protease Vpr
MKSAVCETLCERCFFMRKCFFISIVLCFLLLPIDVYGQAFEKPPSIDNALSQKLQKTIIVVKKGHLQEAVKNVKAHYPNVKIRNMYHHVFEGFSVEGLGIDLQAIKKEKWTEQLFGVTYYQQTMNESVPFIGGDEVRGIFDKENKRLTGKGVKIGIIDTGINMLHRDLQHSYKGGYDFVDVDEYPMETVEKQGPPTYHGTHVAGIIGANGKMKGVAPEADIYMYRALGPGGMGSSEQVILAIEKAIEEKMDVLNLSLGNEINGPDWPTSLAVNEAVRQGVVVVAANGNSGPDLWTVGAPATASEAISVGASAPPLKLPYLEVNRKKVALQKLQGSPNWNLEQSYEIVAGGYGQKNELEDARGKVVLVKRGKISFTEKALNAEKAGAKGVLISNNERGLFAGALQSELKIPVAAISHNDGEELLSKKKDKRLYGVTQYEEIQDKIAPFSSRGPVTTTWEIKPDVLAPGMEINSTALKDYMSLHGTSMAAPHVAGACALILQAHPSWSPNQVKAALMNTAVSLQDDKKRNLPAYVQGSGRVDLKRAIEQTLFVTPSLSLGIVHETKKGETTKKASLTVENISEEPKRLSLQFPKREGIRWEAPLFIDVLPHEKKEIMVKAVIENSRLKKGLHDGLVSVKDSTREIHLPYLFIIGEPSYPKVMGFQFSRVKSDDLYQYELFLPEGADKLGVALYEKDTLRFVQYVDVRENIGRGRFTSVVERSLLPVKGEYKAVIFVYKNAKQQTFEGEITIE